MTPTAHQRSRGGRGRRPNVLTFMPRTLPTTDGTAALAPARHWREPWYTRHARAQKQQTALMLAPCTSIVPYGFWQAFEYRNELNGEFTTAFQSFGVKCQHPHKVTANSFGFVILCTSNALSQSAFCCIGKERALPPVVEAHGSASTSLK